MVNKNILSNKLNSSLWRSSSPFELSSPTSELAQADGRQLQRTLRCDGAATIDTSNNWSPDSSSPRLRPLPLDEVTVARERFWLIVIRYISLFARLVFERNCVLKSFWSLREDQSFASLDFPHGNFRSQPKSFILCHHIFTGDFTALTKGFGDRISYDKRSHPEMLQEVSGNETLFHGFRRSRSMFTASRVTSLRHESLYCSTVFKTS